MRLILLSVLLLVSCTPIAQPSGQQGVMAQVQPSPKPERATPDRGATASVLEFQAIALQATTAANALIATQQAGAAALASTSTSSGATAQAQQTGQARDWTVQGWTATSAAAAYASTSTSSANQTAAAQVLVTQTAQARSTATALAAPAITITAEALDRKVAQDKQAADLTAEWTPRWRWIWLTFEIVFVGFFLWVIWFGLSWAFKAWNYHTKLALAEAGYTGEAHATPTETGAAPVFFVPKGEPGSYERVMLDLDGRDLWNLARGLDRGVPFSELNWRHFPKFRETQDAFLAQGLAEWKDRTAPQQGVILTDAGREFIERVLDRSN